MSLLREIQGDAVSSHTSLATLLRKCKILSVRLGNAQFRAWVDCELNGYQDDDILPEYRVLSVESIGDFVGPWGSGLRNAAIPPMSLPGKLREYATQSKLIHSVSAYESLLAQDTEGALRQHWPSDVVAILGGKIYQNMQCVSAWKVIPSNAVASALDTIRTRVLNFCLEIEAVAPDAGESPINQPPLSQERVTQVFNTYISGDAHNVASGGSGFSQLVSTSIGASEDLFIELARVISQARSDDAVRAAMAMAVDEMKRSAGTPTFFQRYQSFMAILSDHIQVFGPLCAPYLPALTGLIK